MTLHAVNQARTQAPRRLRPSSRGSWDKRPEQRWRRAGPKAVVASSRGRMLSGLMWTVLSLSAGVGLGVIFAQWAGII